jgi:hypothetical protein
MMMSVTPHRQGTGDGYANRHKNAEGDDRPATSRFLLSLRPARRNRRSGVWRRLAWQRRGFLLALQDGESVMVQSFFAVGIRRDLGEPHGSAPPAACPPV